MEKELMIKIKSILESFNVQNIELYYDIEQNLVLKYEYENNIYIIRNDILE